MMDAAGLALSAWHVRLRWSPARKLTTGAPTITGSLGGTVEGQRDVKTDINTSIYQHVYTTCTQGAKKQQKKDLFKKM